MTKSTGCMDEFLPITTKDAKESSPLYVSSDNEDLLQNSDLQTMEESLRQPKRISLVQDQIQQSAPKPKKKKASKKAPPPVVKTQQKPQSSIPLQLPL